MRCLVLLLPLLAGVVQSDQCADVKKTFNDCTRAAHQTYVEAMAKKEDGRPDFRARKTCNYLTDAVETCGNGLMEHDCNTAEEVTAMKDGQISKVLERIGSTVAEFDSCKCPPVKAHVNRVKSAEGVDAPAECPEPTEPATDGASSVLAGLLLLPLLVVHHL